MKPYEYYNYATPKKKAWWLPLVVILVLVVIGSIWRSCSAESDEPLPTGPSQAPIGLVEQGWHTVLLDGKLYHVLDEAYRGEFDLQTVCFYHEAEKDAAKGDVLIPMQDGASFPADFPREVVLDRAEYERFCSEWGLTPAFPQHDGHYAVLAAALSGSADPRIQVGGISVSGQSATLVLRKQFVRRSGNSAGFVLTLPVPASVTELKSEPLYLPEELPGAGSAG